MTLEQVKALLKEHEQEHLLQYYDELSASEQALLLQTIADLDWSFEQELKNPADLTGAGRDINPIKGMDLPEIEARKAEFEAIGVEAIKAGKVAAVGTAILCTALFTLLDDLLTPLFYAYSPRAMKAYFYASLPFLFGQTVCAGVSVGALFLPLTRALAVRSRFKAK